MLIQATDVVVTDRRVLVRGRGDLDLREVRTVALRQSIVERWTGRGALFITGDRRLSLRAIAHAVDVQRAVLAGSQGAAEAVDAPAWSLVVWPGIALTFLCLGEVIHRR
jgi:hypothetical protein